MTLYIHCAVYIPFIPLITEDFTWAQRDRSWTGTVFSVNPCQFTKIVSVYSWAPGLPEDNTVCYKTNLKKKLRWYLCSWLFFGREQVTWARFYEKCTTKIFNYLTRSDFSINMPKIANVSGIFWLRAQLFLVHEEFEEKKKKTSLLDFLLKILPKMTLQDFMSLSFYSLRFLVTRCSQANFLKFCYNGSITNIKRIPWLVKEFFCHFAVRWAIICPEEILLKT